MPKIFFHTFGHVTLLDENEKNVLGSTIKLNLRNTFYTDDEVEKLDKTYRIAVFNNLLCEFELIADEIENKRKVKVGESYTICMYDRKTGAGTNFHGTILKVERTAKIGNNMVKTYYTGIRLKEKCYDGMLIFGDYAPKTIFGFFKDTLKGLAFRVFSRKKEDEIYEKYKDEAIFFNITSLIQKNKDLLEGAPYEIDY
jgi:hypothetical protein